MAIDPFAAAPAPEPEAPFDPAPQESNVVSLPTQQAPAPGVVDPEKIVVTLKGGGGYDAPWIVIHATSIQEADSLLGAEMAALMEKVKKAGAHFSGGTATAAPAQSSAPAHQQAPAGSPECPPGWEYKTGVTKAGKPYKAYFPPRGSNEKPIWL